MVFSGSFTFSSLAPDSEYEVIIIIIIIVYYHYYYYYEVMVQARSELGWSHQTHPFRFSTPR